MFFSKAASPRKWIAFDGKLTEMDTPYTIRSKELRALYDSLNMKFLTQEERMDVLLSLKATVVVRTRSTAFLRNIFIFFYRSMIVN